MPFNHPLPPKQLDELFPSGSQGVRTPGNLQAFHGLELTGRPWLSGANINPSAEKRFTFPRASRYISAVTFGPTLMRIHFAPLTGSVVIGGQTVVGPTPAVVDAFHYTPISASVLPPFQMNVECSDVWVSNSSQTQTGSVFISAELVNNISGTFILTGSGITDGA